jgi:hypothetical protein
MNPLGLFSRAAALCVAFSTMILLVLPRSARALNDEIRVYTDEVTDPGEFEHENHFTTVPRLRGAAQSQDNGSLRGVIFNPELAYGLPGGVELEGGFFVPALRSDDGSQWRIRPQARISWIARPAQPGGDWFFGLNGEWAADPRTPSNAPSSALVRPILGWRDADWLAAANLTITRSLGGTDPVAPTLAPALKVVRTVIPGTGLGAEYYADLGRWGVTDREHPHTRLLYLTVDQHNPWDLGHPWDLHLGVGRGLDAVSGGWTLKGTLQLPLD